MTFLSVMAFVGSLLTHYLGTLVHILEQVSVVDECSATSFAGFVDAGRCCAALLAAPTWLGGEVKWRRRGE